MSAASPRRRLAENSADSREQTAAVGGQGELAGSRAEFFHGGEGASVGEAVAAGGDGQVVATAFSFLADAAGDPPDGRMIEEQRLDRRLDQVYQIVVPADVSQFVGQQRFELLDRQAG